MRKCSKCKEKKDLRDFAPDKPSRGGRRAFCRDCGNKDQVKRAKTINGKLRTLYYDQLSKSKERGHPKPSYSFEDLRDFAYKQPLFFVLYWDWVAHDYNKWYAPSFDRINAKQPYSIDNLEVMTWQDNSDKGRSEKKHQKNSTYIIGIDKTGQREIFESYSDAANRSNYNREQVKRLVVKGKDWSIV